MLASLSSCQPKQSRQIPKRAAGGGPVYFGLTPALTEILFEVCAASELPAVSFGSDYPAAAAKRLQVHTVPVDFEALGDLAPTLIIAEDGMHTPDVYQNLRAQGHTVKVVRLVTFSDLWATLDSLGVWTNHQEQAKRTITRVKREIEPYRYRLKGYHATVGVLFSTGPFMAQTRDSWMHNKLDYLGLTDAFAHKAGPFGTFLAEEIKNTPMNYIALHAGSPQSEALKQILANNPLLHLIYLDDNLASRPSTRLRTQLEDICQAIEHVKP